MRRINYVWFKLSLILAFFLPFFIPPKVIESGKIVTYNYGVLCKSLSIRQIKLDNSRLIHNLFNGNAGMNINILDFFGDVLIIYGIILLILWVIKKVKNMKFK